ncbi:MAG: hypothetical protein EKK31_23080 [Hyphomicrobiales bacterium]|nr:MAG: hypothetical protein EKK31_23080 [Hyphomicrobiales bacterium]
MNADKFLGLGLTAGIAFVCCAAPLLLVAFSSVGFSAWLDATGYAVIPIGLAAIGVAWLYLYRRSRSASSNDTDCCSINGKRRLN